MPPGEHFSRRAEMKDRHARIGAKADVLELQERILEIGRMYPGLLDEIEDEARPGHGSSQPQPPPPVNGSEAPLPLLDASTPPPPPMDPAAIKSQRISAALKGRKQSPETIRKRMETRAANLAAKTKPPSGKRGRPRKTK